MGIKQKVFYFLSFALFVLFGQIDNTHAAELKKTSPSSSYHVYGDNKSETELFLLSNASETSIRSEESCSNFFSATKHGKKIGSGTFSEVKLADTNKIFLANISEKIRLKSIQALFLLNRRLLI